MTLAPQSTDKEHAICGASNSSRWLTCPGSVAMELKVPEPPQSEYAAEGQTAHDLGEIYLLLLTDHYHKTKKDLRKEADITDFATKEDYPIEMRDHCRDYAYLIMDEVLKRKPRKVLVEKKVVLHQGYGMFGTADCFFGYKDKAGKIILCIYDLKYGKGIVVEPNSPQLIYYALAVAETFKLTPDVYHLNIFQPRAEHEDGSHRSFVLQKKEAEKWKKKLIKGAKKALEMSHNKDSELDLAAGDHCTFCNANSVCTKYVEQINKNAAMDFADEPDLLVPEIVNQHSEITTTLSDEQLLKILTCRKDIEKFLSNVVEYAINRYEQGEPIPGTKVVETKPRRRWEGTTTAVANGLKKLGIKDPWDRKLRGLGSIEGELREVHSITAKKAREMIKKMVTMTTPNKTLALEDDPRPGISGAESAQRDFKSLEIPGD